MGGAVASYGARNADWESSQDCSEDWGRAESHIRQLEREVQTLQTTNQQRDALMNSLAENEQFIKELQQAPTPLNGSINLSTHRTVTR